MRVLIGCGLMLATVAVLAACGGGGGSSPAPAPPANATPTPTPAATKSPQSYTVAGTVVQIPSDAYGPTTIDGVTYQSADATQTTPLNGATVIVGPVPIVGATAPASLPAGDVATTTNASGAFTATLAVAPAAPSNAEPFVVPPDNLSGVTPPATGYYVQVFGAGTDGLSAGAPIPLHRFLATSSAIQLRITTATAAEAMALAAVNSDRASNAGAGALAFDEAEEEIARLHASDESSATTYSCHYDTRNVGPSSRYLAGGGVGLTAENLSFDQAGSAIAAFAVAEAAFVGEKTESPPGGHYTNLVDVSHDWAGLAAAQSVEYPGFWNVDYELVTPSAQGAGEGVAGYPISGSCPSGTVVNES
jgi:hypothetical protein